MTNTLNSRGSSVFVFSLWIFLSFATPPAFSNPIHDGNFFSRCAYRMLDCTGEACSNLRFKVGLAIAGRRGSPVINLLTNPRLRPYELLLQSALPQIREMATASPDFMRAMVRLSKGAAPNTLEPILKYLFDPPDSQSTKRTGATRLADRVKKIGQSAALIRSLGEMGILSHDIRNITSSIDPTLPAEELGAEFKRQAAAFLARRIGRNASGIAKLFDVTDRLDPSTSGNLFEAWLTHNYFPDAIGRLHLKTDKLPGSYTRKEIHSDNLLDEGDGWTIIEMKHLRTSHDFGDDQLKQATNYWNLIQHGVPYAPKGQTPKPIKKVVYVFSSRVAAEKNAADIRNRLGMAAEIRYIDRSESKMMTLEAR